MQLGVVLGLSLGIGIPVIVIAFLAFVFSRVRAANAARYATLAHEGIVLDSGPRWITLRLHGYRAPGIAASAAIEKVRATLILTERSLALIPGLRALSTIARTDLARFTVRRADDGALHLSSSEPPNASGTIDIRIPGDDVDRWLAALVEAGAQPK
jgi:hypothetical protein